MITFSSFHIRCLLMLLVVVHAGSTSEISQESLLQEIAGLLNFISYYNDESQMPPTTC